MTETLNFTKAVFLGNSISHFKEAFVSDHQKRYKVLHFSLGLVEALPIIGQIVSLVEAILANHQKNDQLYFSFKAKLIILSAKAEDKKIEEKPTPKPSSEDLPEADPDPVMTEAQHTHIFIQESTLLTSKSIQKEELTLSVNKTSEIINPIVEVSTVACSTRSSISDRLNPYEVSSEDFEAFEAANFLEWAEFLQQQNIPFGINIKPLYYLLIPRKFDQLSEETLLTATSSLDLEQFVLIYEQLKNMKKRSSINQEACIDRSLDWLYNIWCMKIFKIQEIDLSIKSIKKNFDITSETYKLHFRSILSFLTYFISPENHKDHLQSLESMLINLHTVLENGEKRSLESKSDPKSTHSLNAEIFHQLMNVQRVSNFLHGHCHGFLWMGFLFDMQEWKRPGTIQAINIRQFVNDFQELRMDGFKRSQIAIFRQQFSTYFQTDVPDLGSENIRNFCMMLLGIFLDNGIYSSSDPIAHLENDKKEIIETLEIIDSFFLRLAGFSTTITAYLIKRFLPYEKLISNLTHSIDFPLKEPLKKQLNSFAENICNGLVDRIIKIVDLKKILTYKNQIKKLFQLELDVVNARLDLEKKGNTDPNLKAILEKKIELMEQGYIEFFPDLLEIIQHHAKILLNDNDLRKVLQVIDVVMNNIGHNPPPTTSEASLVAYMKNNIFSIFDTLG